MRQTWPRARIHVLYGPTEATIFTAMRTYHPGDAGNMHGSVIGRPVESAGIYVRSRAGRQQPIGVPGEICISGPGLASGYWQRPELTAEKFIAAGFVSGDSIPGDAIPGNAISGDAIADDAIRIYRTGDMGRWLSNGDLEFLGRIDNQVKIRGHRIEPGEVEVVLGRYPGVTGSVVLACSRMNGEKELVGYITGSARFTSSELMSYMSSQLPAYMVPSYYVQLEDWPLTPNGKVNRQALQSAGGETLGTAAVYEAPQGEVEEHLVRIWQQVLDREKIGVRDNFFELGGNSIRIIKVASLASQSLAREVSVTLLFQYPTIRSLAGHLTDNRTTMERQDDFVRSELLSDLEKFNRL